ncbi:alpha/beta hydrolase [Dyella humi]|uniref:Alpha/beta hydrolase n=1 Tax=Dyella humi TaxID=1770547 RepID=A0ABW8IM90_9GAMM
MNLKTNDFASVHPLDPDDAPIVAKMRIMAAPAKGALRGVEARGPFDAVMASVSVPNNVRSEVDTIGGVPGTWVHPANARPGCALLHLHGGWFNFGSAAAFINLVGQIAARVGVSAFIPDYRLAPEHPFPGATEDVWACYKGLAQKGYRRLVLTGDSAGGNLALGLAARTVDAGGSTDAELVGVAVFSPVTDLTLAGETYVTRADADPLFTRAQVVQLVQAYLRDADPSSALASPLAGPVAGLPSVRVHVGDDEVLLDDSRRYVARAIVAGVDAKLDVWMGMPHGFVGRVGTLKAADQAMDAVGDFLAERLDAAL